ncbi:hypothetical protein C7212DRAFT_339128, partial [Tuber magnatum]
TPVGTVILVYTYLPYSLTSRPRPPYPASFLVALNLRTHFATCPEQLYPAPAKEEVGAYLLASWAIPEVTRKEERYNPLR